jgi:molybdopterin biosynthesis enzyme
MYCGKPLINVPGPPLACAFVLGWCVSELIARYLGAKPPRRKTITATLAGPLPATPGMEVLRKLELRRTADGDCAAFPLDSRGGGAIAALTAPAQYVTDGGETGVDEGGAVAVEFLR